jgi:uracil-DNA glycosylase family 4
MIPKPNSCSGCPLYDGSNLGKRTGFSHPSGEGTSGVMIVGEALGRDEEIEGQAFVGKSGQALFQQLSRLGIEREGFTIFNSVACRPPNNELRGTWYELKAIDHCKPNLDAAIKGAKEKAKVFGKTFVIVTLGVIAFRTVMGYDQKKDKALLKNYIAYPHWNERFGCWVLAADHPAYIMRGQAHLWPILQFVFQRALEIADKGLKLDEPDYTLDPPPPILDEWIGGYKRSLKLKPDNPLSTDIETPYKKKTDDEDELEKAEDADHTILRISFAYLDPATGLTHTVSIKWSAEYMAGIEELFRVAPYVLGWNSDHYDFPRLRKHLKIWGVCLDGMQAWHILNSNLRKSLGFVTPFYVQNTLMWKHLSDSAPAYYNAKDADMALRNWFGIRRDLEANNLWHVYQRHWIDLQAATSYMSACGVLLDMEMRDKSDQVMGDLLDQIEASMEAAVPKEARKQKILWKKPKNTDGFEEVVKEKSTAYCTNCGLLAPKRWKKHKALCGGSETLLPLPVTAWSKPLEFKISKVGLTSYQQALKHHAVLSRRERKVTFDVDALNKLIKDYPKDPLYPRILEHRKVQKLHSTYIGVRERDESGIIIPAGRILGGMPVGPDGRIHTVYGRNANTLRFTSEDPNLQNLPRPNPKDPNDLANIIRNLVMAKAGSVLYARDYSGIEAVLTGYFALLPEYIRLAKRDVHTYYTVYALAELEHGARISSKDLPDINWPDEKLFPYLEELKGRFKADRNNLYKHLVHAANFMQGAKGAQAKIFSETGVEYPLKTVQKVMDVYFALFPKIKQWHTNVLGEAERDGYLRNPFDYVCRFSRVYDYKWDYGEWVKKPNPDVSNKVVAFKPQSTAVGIITEAILRLYYDRFEEAGKYLRLQVHDELMFEVPRDLWRQIDQICQEEMERPIKQMPLPASWNMGTHLTVLTEAKADLNEPSRWGKMKGL